MEERTVSGRPPWEPRTRFEIEREMSQLKSGNKRLGEALQWVVDVMLQDESDAQDLDQLRKKKREALESLAYVRDALMGHVTELEDERLFGEEELHKRGKKAEMAAKSAGLHINVPAPAPASVIDSRSRLPISRKNVGQSSMATSRHPAGNNMAGALSAPWHYTRSDFSGDSARLPSSSLPRVPPATSRTVVRGRTAAEDPLRSD